MSGSRARTTVLNLAGARSDLAGLLASISVVALQLFLVAPDLAAHLTQLAHVALVCAVTTVDEARTVLVESAGFVMRVGGTILATAAVAALDVAVLSARLQQLQQPQRDEIQRFHRYEQWRDKLIAGDAALGQQLGQRFGHAWADVSNLIDQARAGKAGASRALFRSLAELDRESDNR